MEEYIKNRIIFGVNFLRHPILNASLIPSSNVASKAMLKDIDFSSIKTIIELGPGTGEMTYEIVSKCFPDTKIILIEREISYTKILSERFESKVIIENKDANAFEEILIKHSIKKVDLIISGLPVSTNREGSKLRESLDRQLAKGARFRFFTYLPQIAKSIFRRTPLKKISFVFRNIPPMWIYEIIY